MGFQDTAALKRLS